MEKVPKLVGILSNQNNKLVGNLGNPQNVMNGSITIPQIVDVPKYEGEYEIIPSSKNTIVLETAYKELKYDLIIKKIPYYETYNEGGYTAYIASEV